MPELTHHMSYDDFEAAHILLTLKYGNVVSRSNGKGALTEAVMSPGGETQDANDPAQATASGSEQFVRATNTETPLHPQYPSQRMSHTAALQDATTSDIEMEASSNSESEDETPEAAQSVNQGWTRWTSCEDRTLLAHFADGWGSHRIANNVLVNRTKYAVNKRLRTLRDNGSIYTDEDGVKVVLDGKVRLRRNVINEWSATEDQALVNEFVKNRSVGESMPCDTLQGRSTSARVCRLHRLRNYKRLCYDSKQDRWTFDGKYQ